MKDAKRSIFRVDALRRYQQSREESVLPRFVSPSTFIFLWILLGLLAAGGFVTWFAQVPIYASGPAIVVDWQSQTQSIRDQVVVIAFLPPENLSRLRVGQTLFIRLDQAGERIGTPVIAAEPEISSPDAIQKRFALSVSAAQAITQPSAVAIAKLDPPPLACLRLLMWVVFIGSISRSAHVA